MEGQYGGELGSTQSARQARQSLAEFVNGESMVAGVGRDLSLAERKLLVSPKRLPDESPWLQFTGKCQRF
jgi:hypothetical protein